MNTFVNPNKVDYYSGNVIRYSEGYKPITKGITRSFVSNKEWVGNMLFNNPDNNYINPHASYLSFYSYHDFTAQNFSNNIDVDDILLRDQFGFINSYTGIGDNLYELSSGEYNIVGQNNGESVDIILDSFEYVVTDKTEFKGRYYGDKFIYFGVWARRSLTTSQIADYRTQYTTYDENKIEIVDRDWCTDIKFSAADAPSGPGDDFYSIVKHYENRYIQDYTRLSDNTMSLSVIENNIPTPHLSGCVVEVNGINERLLEFTQKPEVYKEGVINSYECTFNTTDSIKRYDDNPVVNNWEYSDQNRFLFNIPKSAIKQTGGIEFNIGNVAINGIDFYAERNRRGIASTVVEPYMVTKPLNRGQQVEVWLTEDGVLAVKAPESYHSEISNTLHDSRVNTDVIHSILLDVSSSDMISDPNDYYFNFADDNRINLGTMDIVGGEVKYVNSSDHGGVYKSMYLKIPFVDNSLYDSDELDIAGISKCVRYDKGVRKEYHRVYCTNFRPEDYAKYVDVNAPSMVDRRQWCSISDPAKVVSSTEGERFSPLLRLPDSKGFVKIVGIERHFNKVKELDGDVTKFYNIEIPYAYNVYGSLSTIDRYKTCIEYIDTYHEAGSQKVVNSTKDLYNSRYMPYGDDIAGVCKVFEKDGVTFKAISTTKTTMTVFDLNKDYASLNAYISSNSNDVAILTQMDGRSWKVGDRYLPYINRENPSFLFRLSLKEFMDNTALDCKNHLSLPDIKRYISSMFVGGGECRNIVNDIEYNAEYHKETRIPVDTDTSTNASIVLQIYDNIEKAWRPISQSIGDNSVEMSKLTVDSMSIINSSVSNTVIDSEYRMVTLMMFRIAEDTFLIDCDVWGELKQGVYNMAIKDTAVDQTYKVIYAVGVSYGGGSTVCEDSNINNPSTQAVIANIMIKQTEIADFLSRNSDLNEGNLDLGYTSAYLNNSNSNIIESKLDNNPRYLDLRDESDRYIIDDNIYIRSVIVSDMEANSYYVSEGVSGYQMVKRDSGISAYNPWYGSQKFDWSLASPKALTYRLSSTYFNVTSV